MDKLTDKLKSKYHLRKVQPVKSRNSESHKILSGWRQLDRGVLLKRKNARQTKEIDNKNPQIKNLKIFKRKIDQKSQVKQNVKFISSLQQRASEGCGFLNSQDRTLRNQFYQRESRLEHQKSMNLYRHKKIEVASRNKSLKYWRRSPESKILTVVKNFFNNIFQSEKGCTCNQPCIWAIRFFAWAKMNQQKAKNQYLQLAEIMEMRKLSNQSYQQKQLDKNFKQIKKDIERTQPEHPTYQNIEFLNSLQRILMCYVIQDAQLGYVQGMNLILSGIIFHVKNQHKSYFIFKKLMKEVRSIYLEGFKQCYMHIEKIIALVKDNINDLYMHFEQLGIDLNVLCLPWVLSLMTGIVKLDYSHLIYDGFIKQKWMFIYKICLSILLYFKEELMSKDDACDILTMLSSNNEQTYNLNWNEIVGYANELKISLVE